MPLLRTRKESVGMPVQQQRSCSEILAWEAALAIEVGGLQEVVKLELEQRQQLRNSNQTRNWINRHHRPQRRQPKVTM